MLSQLLHDAITQRRVVAFSYNDKPRIVEPHAYGKTSRGVEVLRAFQVLGESDTAETGWKLFNVDKIEGLSPHDFLNQAPRPGYVRGDRMMAEIYAEV